MINRIAEITARCDEAIREEGWQEPVYGSSAYTLVMQDIPFLLSLLAERDAEIERLRAWSQRRR